MIRSRLAVPSGLRVSCPPVPSAFLCAKFPAPSGVRLFDFLAATPAGFSLRHPLLHIDCQVIGIAIQPFGLTVITDDVTGQPDNRADAPVSNALPTQVLYLFGLKFRHPITSFRKKVHEKRTTKTDVFAPFYSPFS